MLNFKPLNIDDKSIYDKYLTKEYQNSESSFANMFAWREIMKTHFAYDKYNSYFIYTKRNGKIAACFPKGLDPLYGINALKEYFNHMKSDFLIESVTKEELDFIIDCGFDVEAYEDIDLYDYVYSAERLMTLSGKKLHSKRNHINKFMSLYPSWNYSDLNENYLSKCLEFSKKQLLEKYADKNNLDYVSEISAIKAFIDNFDRLKLTGGVLLVDEEIAAFTIGEKLNESTCVVHIEKADTSFEGAYAMINNLYIKNKWKNITYVNREEDMGIEGLRKAKKSYYPEFMVEKYIVKFN